MIVLVVLGLGGLVAACGPQPTRESKNRVNILAEDPIKNLLPPGGRLLRKEYKDPGHPTEAPFGQGRPTVTRDYTFTGDFRAAAVSVTQQARRAGWFAILGCTLEYRNVFSVRGLKQFDGFTAALDARIRTLDVPTNGGPRVDVDISAPFPGEETSVHNFSRGSPPTSQPQDVVCDDT